MKFNFVSKQHLVPNASARASTRTTDWRQLQVDRDRTNGSREEEEEEEEEDTQHSSFSATEKKNHLPFPCNPTTLRHTAQASQESRTAPLDCPLSLSIFHFFFFLTRFLYIELQRLSKKQVYVHSGMRGRAGGLCLSRERERFTRVGFLTHSKIK